jgi:hypothetical protein
MSSSSHIGIPPYSSQTVTTLMPALEFTQLVNDTPFNPFALGESIDEKSGTPKWLKFAFVFLYIVMFFFGLIGNIVVIYFVLFYKRMQTMTDKFITNLSLADLLVICVCIPVTVSSYYSDQWLFGQFMCYVTSFVQGK